MTKAELIDKVADDAGLTKKDAAAAVNATFDAITGELAGGGSVTVTGFGTFDVRERKARQGVNPSTGAKIQIAASKAPGFKAGKSLKDAVK
jgi:nucleoid DNA-binding protein